MAAPHPLSALATGATGIVMEMRLPAHDRSRLMELGLVPGTPVELLRFALLDDPVEIRVRGSQLSLRRHEADQILVQPG
jgi:ferrous iron transport protein A